MRAVGRRSDSSVTGATPYRALLEMLNKLDTETSEPTHQSSRPPKWICSLVHLRRESERRILDWCVKYGLLGILQHRLFQVVLPARNGAQVEYSRTSIGWAVVERMRENPSTPILAPHAVVQPLRGVGLTVERLSETWARFFPGVQAEDHTCLRIRNRSPIRSVRCMPSRSKIFSQAPAPCWEC